MRSHFRHTAALILSIALAGTATGCAGTSYSKTALKYGMTNVQTQLTRNDVSIGNRLESSSSTTYILFGLLSFGGDPEAIAYQKLLAQMPDADEVVGLSEKYDSNGLPPLFWTGTATVFGKPVTIKSDTATSGQNR